MHSIVDTCQVWSIYRAALLPCCTLSWIERVRNILCVCSHCIYLCCSCFFSYLLHVFPVLAACLFRFRNSQSWIRFGHFSFGNSTRHFRSHWVKGKSKLNCPKAAAEIYDLFVLSDQTGTLHPTRPYNRLAACLAPQTSALEEWLCGRLYITCRQRKQRWARGAGQSSAPGLGSGLILAWICIAACIGLPSWFLATHRCGRMNVKCAFVFRTPKVMIILLSQLHSACLSDISTEFPQGKLRFLSLSCHFVFFNICLTRSRLVHELALTYFALAHCIAQLFGEKFRGHNHNVPPLPQLLPDLAR